MLQPNATVFSNQKDVEIEGKNAVGKESLISSSASLLSLHV